MPAQTLIIESIYLSTIDVNLVGVSKATKGIIARPYRFCLARQHIPSLMWTFPPWPPFDPSDHT